MPSGVYPKPSPLERLLKMIRKTDYCWLWTGYSKNRYGSIKVGNKYEKAHRFAYTIWVGLIPENMYVCHKCDNTLCVNPDHLFLGTQKDNMKDMKNKGRERKAKGSSAGRSKLSKEQVIEIRQILSMTNITCWQLAKKYNVSANAIRCIKLKQSWKHI